ncbi:helix-turn-helix transcriptional regulator [Halovivax cerinus]|uniref:Helix-turn-helix transcriptional regulator n=1 Tax=Halovivax cerinus TaxID=1487865 RepID=A0ABD5NQ94_9EURY|nr:hypothetical protein [Halovivax cerinus]
MTGAGYETAIELLRYAPVLEACRSAPRSRRELVEETGTSRTTIYRATVALEERDLVKYDGDGYRTTARGGALSRASASFRATTETIERLEPLFDVVSHPELLDNAYRLDDPTVTVVDASNPYRVADRAVERFEERPAVRGVTASATDAEAFARAGPLLSEKSRVEWLFTETAFDAHETINDEFRRVLSAPTISIGIVPDEAVPFSFSVDEDVSIVGHDDRTGLPTVLVESDSQAAHDWLRRRFEELDERATPLETWIDERG